MRLVGCFFHGGNQTLVANCATVGLFHFKGGKLLPTTKISKLLPKHYAQLNLEHSQNCKFRRTPGGLLLPIQNFPVL
jgi:hypothetical protein